MIPGRGRPGRATRRPAGGFAGLAPEPFACPSQFEACDGPQVDFVGSVGEVEGADAGPHCGQRGVGGDPGAAVGLDGAVEDIAGGCLLYTSPSPRD